MKNWHLVLYLAVMLAINIWTLRHVLECNGCL